MTDRTCTAEGCDRTLTRHDCRGLCNRHYKRWRAANKSDTPAVPCSITDCARATFARGWCQQHYHRWRKYGDPAAEYPRPRYGPGDTCSIADCDRAARARGWCQMHWRRWWVTGTTDLCTLTPEERFLAKVDRRGDDECWPFASVGSDSRGGYGIFMFEGKNWGAHVWAYVHFIGPIPPGHHVDHVRANGCTRRDCVNWVRHLEAVTPRENAIRGVKTKVTDEQALALYRRWKSGESQVSLGREVGVNSATLSRRFKRLAIVGLIPWAEDPGEPSRSLPAGPVYGQESLPGMAESA